jgi:hypothetical protein
MLFVPQRYDDCKDARGVSAGPLDILLLTDSCCISLG